MRQENTTTPSPSIPRLGFLMLYSFPVLDDCERDCAWRIQQVPCGIPAVSYPKAFEVRAVTVCADRCQHANNCKDLMARAVHSITMDKGIPR